MYCTVRSFKAQKALIYHLLSGQLEEITCHSLYLVRYPNLILNATVPREDFGAVVTLLHMLGWKLYLSFVISLPLFTFVIIIQPEICAAAPN